jgi:hypothetical protein
LVQRREGKGRGEILMEGRGGILINYVFGSNEGMEGRGADVF